MRTIEVEERDADTCQSEKSVPGVLWWGQLVTSPLWAQELSFEHLLEIDNKKLSTQRVSEFCLPNRTTCNLAYFYPPTLFGPVDISSDP